MNESLGWGLIEWGLTSGAVAVTFIWGYMVMKLKAMWKSDDDKVIKVIEKTSKDLKEELKKDVTAMVNNFASRIDKDIAFQANQIEENKKSVEMLHRRISDANRDTDKKFEDLRKDIQEGNRQHTAILNNILLSVGRLEGKAQKDG